MEYKFTIVVNARLLLKNKLEGIGRFSHEILKRITPAMPDCHFILLFDRPFDETFIYSKNITPVLCSPPTRHVFLYYYWLQYSVRPFLKKLQPDLFFSPDGLSVLGTHVPCLPVIHDINFEHYPEFHRFWARNYYRYFFPRFARSAKKIITVSEFSKTDICTTYGISPDKIDVVGNAPSEIFCPSDRDTQSITRKKYSEGKKYFVYVGSLHPRKNITGLFRAFSEFKKIKPGEEKLVLVGPVYWGMNEIYKVLKELKLDDFVVFTNRLSDEELNKVLGSAEALVYIPFFEGFGIPVLEAFATRVPVITSNVSSLPEVARDGAILVNPDDAVQTANAMRKIIENPIFAQELIQKGIMVLNQYSWDKSANKTVKILYNLLYNSKK